MEEETLARKCHGFGKPPWFIYKLSARKERRHNSVTRFVKFTLFSNKTRSTRLQKTIIKKLYRKRKLKLSDCRVISYFLFCCCC